MREFVGEAMVHGFVAAGVIGALVRAWGVGDPRLRVRLRLLVLLTPIVLPPLLAAAAPWRASESFRSRAALLDTSTWSRLGAGAWDIEVLALLLCGAMGAAMYLRDAVPLVMGGPATGHADPAVPEVTMRAVRTRLAALAVPMRMAPPPVAFVAHDGPALMTAGIRRPSIRLTRALTDRLDDEELACALAHEMAHVERRDPLFGWVLMGLRSVLFFHPMAQLAGREIARDVERVADDAAVLALGRPEVLASAVLKLARESRTDHGASRRRVAPVEALGRFTGRWSDAELASRVRRLLDGPADHTATWPVARMLMAATTIGVLLFLVV